MHIGAFPTYYLGSFRSGGSHEAVDSYWRLGTCCLHLLVPSAGAVSVLNVPTVLPPGSSGDWPTCASPEEQMCIDSVSVQVGGQDVDYVTAGLAAHVSTLDGDVSSFNWSIQGSWNVDSA